VEVAWQKPSECDSGTTECVELYRTWNDKIYMRSSLAPSKIISFTPEEMKAFIGAVKKGEYDAYTL
jgi:hypothetical protein